jgi:hypothetical protein
MSKKNTFNLYLLTIFLVVFSFFYASMIVDTICALCCIVPFFYVYEDKRFYELLGVVGLITTAVFNLNLFLLIVSCLLVLYLAGFITNVFFKKHVNYEHEFNCKGKFLLDLLLDNVCIFCFYLVDVSSFFEFLVLNLLLIVGFAALVLLTPVALQPLACALIVSSFVFVILSFVIFFIKKLFKNNTDEIHVVYLLFVVLLACGVCSVVFLPTLVLNLLMQLNFLVEFVSITLPFSFYLFACIAFGVSLLVDNAFCLYFMLRKKENVIFDVKNSISLSFLKGSCKNEQGYKFATFNSNFIKSFVWCLFGLNFFGLGLIYNFLISALVANRFACVCLFGIHAILQDAVIIMIILLLGLKFSLGLAPIIALFCLYVLLNLGVSSVVSSIKLNVCSLIFVFVCFLCLFIFSLLDVVLTGVCAIAVFMVCVMVFLYERNFNMKSFKIEWMPVEINQKLAECFIAANVLEGLDKAVSYMETSFEAVVGCKGVANDSNK